MQKGFLLDKEMLEIFSELDESVAGKIVEGLGGLGIGERVITKDVFSENIEKIKGILIGENKAVIEKFFVNVGYSKVEIGNVEEVEQEVEDIKIISAPMIVPRKVEVKDFIQHFRGRYEQISKILQGRDLENLTSIRRIGDKRESFTIIGAVLNKRITKNKNLFLDVEDLTGVARVLINQNKKELFEKAKDLLVDDIVAFNVAGNSEILFANDVIFPDSFLQEKKKGKKDEWVAFCSDLHIGSKMFLEDNFLKFVKWLNGEEGDEKQREIAKKVKYVLITGDSVDGVGIFPEQDKLLNLKDFNEQYNKLIEILKLIRKDVKIIICPGQHDAVWVGEPQPIIGEKYASGLYELENVVLVPNPSLIEIQGFKILMYHGASMHGIIEGIQDIRVNHGHNSPTRVVKEMLKRRHLAPMHGSVDYVPCEKDYLVISQIPDIVATGDQHRAEVSMYNNILLVASSCWQSITPFEEKVGNNPDPCKVPLFNFKTREIKILDFSDEVEEQGCEEKEEKIVCEVKDGGA